MSILGLIITLAIISGQLVKVSIGGGGATLIDLAVLCICLIGLCKIKFKLKFPPKFIIAGLFFCLVSLLSLIFSPLTLTNKEFLTSFFYIIRFLSYILLGWLIYSKALPFLKQDINQILVISGVGLSILGLWQFIFIPNLGFLASFGWDPHFYRTVSSFLDPNFLGAFLVLTLLLIFQNVLSLKRNLKVVLSIIVYFALMTTFSRSSYGMFLISFLYFSFFKKSFKLFLLTIILFITLLISFQIYIRAVNKVTPLDRSQTASFRLSTWQQGLEIFLKNPILGIGYNAYNFALRQYKLGNQQFLSGKGATSNDSSLVHIASTTGILGLITYFYFLLSLYFYKGKDIVLSSAILGLLGHSFFVNSLFYPPILIWLILFASSLDNEKIIK